MKLTGRLLPRNLVPRSLTGQLILLLLLALGITHLIAAYVYQDQHTSAVRAASRVELVARTAAMVRLLQQSPPELRAQLLRSASGPRLRFWSTPQPAVSGGTGNPRLEQRLARLLQSEPEQVHVAVRHTDAEAYRRLWRSWHRQAREHGDLPARRAPRPRDDQARDGGDGERGERRRVRHMRRPAIDLAMSVAYADGQWLNVETVLPPPPPLWHPGALAALGVTALGIIIIVVVVVRRVTQASSSLADAARRFGRGESMEPLPEQGPEDIRVAVRAFNAMREQLTRFVQSRTQMLAAISHDLRTPLTALRVRAELIDDDDNRERMQASIDEMSSMVESALEFARAADHAESTRKMDLTSLADSVCEDLNDLGHEIRFEEGPPVTVPCRALSIKRALRNLVENALRHAGDASVRVSVQGDEAWLQVRDSGPGIPEEALTRVTEPFVRLEDSRSRDTGGVGMGLAIAASVARAHGGELTLRNRPEGGLEATLRLPLDAR